MLRDCSALSDPHRLVTPQPGPCGPAPRDNFCATDRGAPTAHALQAAEEALRRQTEALALAAHELRGPLMPMRAVAALLAKSPSVDDLQRLGAMLDRQVTLMARLIDDLLDTSRVATGKLHLDRQRLDLQDVFGAALDMCRPAMEARRQRFVAQLPAGALVVDGDALRLTQVFANLLNNASKYTPEHGLIALSCHFDCLPSGALGVVVRVSDNGIGISAQAMPTIFEPFVQDALAIGFSKEGLGVGLTLVRELVQAHGGSVMAFSAGEGQGSDFSVGLPLA